MSGFVLRDPATGTGMRVSPNQRGAVEALSLQEEDLAAIKGYKFNVNTGDITLTNATKTSVLYIKNNGQYDMVIDQIIYNLGNTTSGSGDIKVEVLRNPETGDIISNANNVLVGTGNEANENFTSNNLMSGLFYKGATGETALSGGEGVVLSTRAASNTGRFLITGAEMVLPEGASMGVDYTPPTGNTSQTVQFAVAIHIRHPSFVDLNI